MTTLNIEKRNHHGNVVWTYPGEILDRGESWICLRAIFDRHEANLGFVVFRLGDVFFEWFFSDQWFNIFEVHEGDSDIIKGWYCNITRPAVIEDHRVYADDLALDVFVTPKGTVILLDEDEFAALELSTDERMAALHAIQALRQLVISRETPFDAIT